MIIRMLKELARFPIQKFRRYKARPAITKLTSHEHPIMKAVGIALSECSTNVISDDEKALISSIEKRRSVLLKSEKHISFIDYGAGNSNSNRMKEEMKVGVKSTALVSKICSASKPEFWATFLFKLIRKIKPSSCVELGTYVGISASYLASALTSNGKGNLLSLEGSPEIAKIAEETLEGLNLQNVFVVTGPFHETLKGVLKSAKPIDFFFNDGHHDHDAVIQYFHEALPYLSNEAVIVFDDISWSPGMRKAWGEIEADARVAASINLQTMGIAIITTKMAAKETVRIRL